MEYFLGGYFGAGANQFSPEKRHGEPKPGDTVAVDDLLDFSNADAIMSDSFFDNAAGDSNVVVPVDSGNSTVSGNIVPCAFAGGDSQFYGGELFVPYDNIAELEWLSNFVEDSFSTEEEMKTLKLLSGGATVSSTTATKPHTSESSSSSENDTIRNTSFRHVETLLPGKVRSKRSRIAPGDWSTRLVQRVTPPKTKKEGLLNMNSNDSNNVECCERKCLHCGAEKTPQWRSGPMGPKTLCNACGVRFKSGRLVPEYRPATSPTFVSTKHSNSHRKVMELRRQKEVQLHHHQHQQLIGQTSIFDVSSSGDDYLIHHHHHHY
ncbi:unnamed protein product [Lupinus luteus]|uniref:GATA transcription factor n=1 Tax=Lupinus luteus TaxID=3873 RepID=A0AAV1YMN8_LUPLU